MIREDAALSVIELVIEVVHDTEITEEIVSLLAARAGPKSKAKVSISTLLSMGVSAWVAWAIRMQPS